MDNEPEGVFDKIKKLVGVYPASQHVDLSGINLPWHLARCDAAVHELIPLFKTRIFVRKHTERTAYYAMLKGMVADVISSLNRTDLYRSKFLNSTKKDPTLPSLHIIFSSLALLENASLLSSQLAVQEDHFDTLSISVIGKIHALDDCSADIEVNMLHNVAELLESISGPLQKFSEARRRLLSKADQERYAHAFAALSKHYAEKTENLFKE